MRAVQFALRTTLSPLKMVIPPQKKKLGNTHPRKTSPWTSTSQRRGLFSPLSYPNRKSSWLVKGCILTFDNPHHVLNSGTASNSWRKREYSLGEELFFAEMLSSAPVKV